MIRGIRPWADVSSPRRSIGPPLPIASYHALWPIRPSRRLWPAVRAHLQLGHGPSLADPASFSSRGISWALVNLLSLTERRYKVNTLSGLALHQLKRPGRMFAHPTRPNRNGSLTENPSWLRTIVLRQRLAARLRRRPPVRAESPVIRRLTTATA